MENVVDFYVEVKSVDSCPNRILGMIKVSPKFIGEVTDFDNLVGTITFKGGFSNLYFEEYDVEIDPSLESDVVCVLKMLKVDNFDYSCNCDRCKFDIENGFDLLPEDCSETICCMSTLSEDDFPELEFVDSCNLCEDYCEDCVEEFEDDLDENTVDPDELIEISLYEEETNDFICNVHIKQSDVDFIFSKGLATILEDYVDTIGGE